jgi:spermidine synthase
VGIVGLGVGTIAAYSRQGDHFTYYEINPEVIRQAREYFTYLGDCEARIDVVLGDGRLSLERQDSQHFDLLVLDAFTSDAVPVHLLTREAFQVYLDHTREDGIIALHISTNHVDLQSVVRRIAEHFDLSVAWIESYGKEEDGTLDADWLLISKSAEIINKNAIRIKATPFEKAIDHIDLWTDDHANLLQVLK